MKKLAFVWWVIKHWKAFFKVYNEGKDVYVKIKMVTRDESDGGKHITKAEYQDVIDQIAEFVDSLKLGGK